LFSFARCISLACLPLLELDRGQETKWEIEGGGIRKGQQAGIPTWSPKAQLHYMYTTLTKRMVPFLMMSIYKNICVNWNTAEINRKRLKTSNKELYIYIKLFNPCFVSF